MAMLDARQFRRRRLAAGMLAFRMRRGLLVFELGFDGGYVHVDRFVKQRALFVGQSLADLAIADTAVIRHLMRQGPDLEVLLGQQRILARHRCLLLVQSRLLLLEQRPHLRQHGRVDTVKASLSSRSMVRQCRGLRPCLQAKQHRASTAATRWALVPIAVASQRPSPAIAIARH